jgi:two-component system, response regulator PdtaR
MHAYIIEDDYLIGQSIQDILSDIGFSRFSFARSEDVAVLGAGEQKFDLITADARLLPGDGVSAVETICARRDIPVVFVTGYSDDIRERVPDAVIVAKPIKEDELKAAVQRVLGHRKTGATPDAA